MTFHHSLPILAICLAPYAVFAADPAGGPIRFEDATAQSGIRFTHSFGSAAARVAAGKHRRGRVWFDYNNDGLLDLFVASGRPLGPGMHPTRCASRPQTPPHNHLYRNDGNGKFTDVTDQAGVAGDLSAWPPSPPISITMATPTCW